MAQYDIWVEGYPKQGVNATAVMLGTFNDENFQGACLQLVKKDEMFGKYFNRQNRTFMGCRIFATEEKARKRWG